MVAVFAFVFLDAVKVKSRMFVMCAGIIFIFVTVRNIYINTLTDINQGIVLFDYSIQGNKYNFMKQVYPTIYIFTDHVIQYERHLYRI